MRHKKIDEQEVYNMYQLHFHNPIPVHFIGIGGISMSGGRGRILGVVFGSMSFTIIDKIITALGLNPLINDTIKGAILLLAIACGGLILWQHRGNIRRLLNGTESKFHLHKKKE